MDETWRWAASERDPTPSMWLLKGVLSVDIEWTRKHLLDNGGAGATLPGSDGAKLVDGLEVAAGEHVIIKKRFSGFSHTHLDLMLRRLGTTETTPNCIRATAVDALRLDHKVLVLSDATASKSDQVLVLTDATASKSDQVQESNLEDMRCMGIVNLKTAEWTAQV
eukprot:gene31540-6725_t